MEAEITASEAFLRARPRRNRGSATLRRMVRETRLSPDQLILPLFAVSGQDREEQIAALPGHARLSPDLIGARAARAFAAGVPAVLLFGLADAKDADASDAYRDDAAGQEAIRAIKAAVPDMLVISDVCLCAFTDHGHCGGAIDDHVDNDASLDLLAQTAVSHADAGVDLVAPSDMMDGRVAAIRSALDRADHSGVGIMSYAAKYASSFYGPFREAAASAPGFGDRRGYQMDPANRREAAREIALDVSEGADVIMIKPALAYLDVIADTRAALNLPVAAYQVSGEYGMIAAAAERGWLVEREAVLETLTAISRAGADLIISYYAEQAAAWLAEEPR